MPDLVLSLHCKQAYNPKLHAQRDFRDSELFIWEWLQDF